MAADSLGRKSEPIVFFFQAEDGIRDGHVTGVQTCALPISTAGGAVVSPASGARPAHPVTAYVVNSSSDTVTPIRAATNTAGKAIKVGHFPDAIAITPDGRTAFVVNSGSGTVTPIRTATGTAGKAIKVGSDPVAIAITPDGKTAYIANDGTGTVTPIRTATGTAGKAIKAGTAPVAIAITPDGKTAYVASEGLTGKVGTVTPIRTAT